MRAPAPAAPPQRQAARHCPRAMQQHTRTDTRALRGLLTPARAADNGRRATDRRSAWLTGPTIISTVGPVAGRARTRPRSTAAATDSGALPAAARPAAGPRPPRANFQAGVENEHAPCEMIRFCTDSDSRTALPCNSQRRHAQTTRAHARAPHRAQPQPRRRQAPA